MPASADDLFAAQVCLRDGWPAIESVHLGGWQLRAGQGGYNRANSVWPGRFTGEVSLDEAIVRVETFYRDRGLGPRFQILDIAAPAGLDAALEQRGYLHDIDCSDMAKAVIRVPPPAYVHVVRDAPDDWLALYGAEQPPEKRAEFPRIISKLPAARGFIVCRRNGRAEAVALVTRAGRDVAIDCVLTRPDARRSGAARSVLLTAEAWAAGEGATRLLLSVVNENTAAMPMYLQLGYRKIAAYHYRYKAG